MAEQSQETGPVVCKTPGCGRIIQPATAKRTGGFCGPCLGKREEAIWAEYVRTHRRDVDLYAGVTDPVEMLRIMHEPRKHDPLVNLLPPPQTFEQLYAALAGDAGERVMEMALETLRRGDEEVAETIARYLAAFTDFRLDRMLMECVDRGLFHPPLIFRGAEAAVRDAVLRWLRPGQFRSVGPVDASGALEALAWVGDEQVLEFLRACEASPPEWTQELYISPADYARAAAWELAPTGRRELSFGGCLALLPDSGPPSESDAVAVMREAASDCPWCGRKLVSLLRLDLNDPAFAMLGVEGPRLEVLTCDLCTCYGDFIYAALDEYGRGRLHSANMPPEFLPVDRDRGENPWAGVRIKTTPRRPLHAADWGLPTTLSQIGGFPAWVQDFTYPKCPDCRQTMMFLAQIDQAHFRTSEGIYYAFLCRTCRVTATTYQQT